MARKIVITGGKGGVGKTTVACALACYLAGKGKSVALCDADLGLNNVDVALGVENAVTYDLVDVIEGRCRATQALIAHPQYPSLHILTSSHSAPERYVSPQSLKLVLDALSPKFDYIFIDCPAGIEDGFHRAVSVAEEAVVVTTPSIGALRDADKVVTLLKSYRLSSITCVVNKIRGDLLVGGESLSPGEIADILHLPLLGVIPEAYGVYQGDFSRLHPALKMLGNNVLLGKNKLYDVTKKYVGFLGGIRKALKRSI